MNFILTSASTVTLTGHLYDAKGVALANQYVTLQGNNIFLSSTTDTTGRYSFQVTPGVYAFRVQGSTSENSGLAAPLDFDIYKKDLNLSTSTQWDITLPAKEVTAHVQDQQNVPISGVGLTVPLNRQTVTLSGIADVQIFTAYFQSIKTNAEGNATLWMAPNVNGSKYTINANPPQNSIYGSATLPNITITTDDKQLLSPIILPSAVTLTGHLYDAKGVALANQYVTLQGMSSDVFLHKEFKPNDVA